MNRDDASDVPRGADTRLVNTGVMFATGVTFFHSSNSNSSMASGEYYSDSTHVLLHPRARPQRIAAIEAQGVVTRGGSWDVRRCTRQR